KTRGRPTGVFNQGCRPGPGLVALRTREKTIADVEPPGALLIDAEYRTVCKDSGTMIQTQNNIRLSIALFAYAHIEERGSMGCKCTLDELERRGAGQGDSMLTAAEVAAFQHRHGRFAP